MDMRLASATVPTTITTTYNCPKKTVSTTTMTVASNDNSESVIRSEQVNMVTAEIGNYQVRKLTLGKGNFSTVKLAQHKITKHLVAIKIINTSVLSDDNNVKIRREIDIMKKLEAHENIVNLYQIIQTKRHLMLVMERCKNGDLFDFMLANGRLNEQQAAFYFRQIVSAVCFLHKHNIVHRDLKAENVLLTNHNQCVKIADFGFANFFDTTSLLSTWCGSPPYAAPELFKRQAYIGPSVDVWSMGVILYVLCCGALPFDGPTIETLQRRVLFGRFRVPFYLSTDCEALLRTMLRLDQARRIATHKILEHKWLTKYQCATTNPKYDSQQQMTTINNENINASTVITDDSSDSSSLAQRDSNSNTNLQPSVQHPPSLAEASTGNSFVMQSLGPNESFDKDNDKLINSTSSRRKSLDSPSAASSITTKATITITTQTTNTIQPTATIISSSTKAATTLMSGVFKVATDVLKSSKSKLVAANDLSPSSAAARSKSPGFGNRKLLLNSIGLESTTISSLRSSFSRLVASVSRAGSSRSAFISKLAQQTQPKVAIIRKQTNKLLQDVSDKTSRESGETISDDDDDDDDDEEVDDCDVTRNFSRMDLNCHFAQTQQSSNRTTTTTTNNNNLESIHKEQSSLWDEQILKFMVVELGVAHDQSTIIESIESCKFDDLHAIYNLLKDEPSDMLRTLAVAQQRADRALNLLTPIQQKQPQTQQQIVASLPVLPDPSECAPSSPVNESSRRGESFDVCSRQSCKINKQVTPSKRMSIVSGFVDPGNNVGTANDVIANDDTANDDTANDDRETDDATPTPMCCAQIIHPSPNYKPCDTLSKHSSLARVANDAQVSSNSISSSGYQSEFRSSYDHNAAMAVAAMSAAAAVAAAAATNYPASLATSSSVYSSAQRPLDLSALAKKQQTLARPIRRTSAAVDERLLFAQSDATPPKLLLTPPTNNNTQIHTNELLEAAVERAASSSSRQQHVSPLIAASGALHDLPTRRRSHISQAQSSLDAKNATYARHSFDISSLKRFAASSSRSSSPDNQQQLSTYHRQQQKQQHQHQQYSKQHIHYPQASIATANNCTCSTQQSSANTSASALLSSEDFSQAGYLMSSLTTATSSYESSCQQLLDFNLSDLAAATSSQISVANLAPKLSIDATPYSCYSSSSTTTTNTTTPIPTPTPANTTTQDINYPQIMSFYKSSQHQQQQSHLASNQQSHPSLYSQDHKLLGLSASSATVSMDVHLAEMSNKVQGHHELLSASHSCSMASSARHSDFMDTKLASQESYASKSYAPKLATTDLSRQGQTVANNNDLSASHHSYEARSKYLARGDVKHQQLIGALLAVKQHQQTDQRRSSDSNACYNSSLSSSSSNYCLESVKQFNNQHQQAERRCNDPLDLSSSSSLYASTNTNTNTNITTNNPLSLGASLLSANNRKQTSGRLQQVETASCTISGIEAFVPFGRISPTLAALNIGGPGHLLRNSSTTNKLAHRRRRMSSYVPKVNYVLSLSSSTFNTKATNFEAQRLDSSKVSNKQDTDCVCSSTNDTTTTTMSAYNDNKLPRHLRHYPPASHIGQLRNLANFRSLSISSSSSTAPNKPRGAEK